MKNLPYIIILILSVLLLFRPARVEHVSGEVIRDTIITNRIDTVRDTVYCLLRRKSIKTAFIQPTCRATGQSWIVSRCTVKQGLCLSESGQRFGLGVQAGYGFSGNKASPYIGVGVSYNLWEW